MITMKTLLNGVRRFYRTYRPKMWTKSEDEFLDFVRDNRAEYVSVFGAKVLLIQGSDDGEMLYEVRAMTMTPFGKIFGYKRRVQAVWSHATDKFNAGVRADGELRQAVAAFGQQMPTLVPANVRVSVQG